MLAPIFHFQSFQHIEPLSPPHRVHEEARVLDPRVPWMRLVYIFWVEEFGVYP